ncbi:hypothetical protein BZG36_00500 [Bifiguratus adelaidae]|uniref:Structural maintenance of chromosomes protein n=1 Tax=Bifiguratus adelaidae TaxID=1938954 RepID=A0A261Y7H0_9FUNG|nr:hypothetical protein BZG36_00500 [Bifiguratus adelaidae]
MYIKQVCESFVNSPLEDDLMACSGVQRLSLLQITIQGFKSYKDQTVMEPFSPKHNVIVGRNGSGKSNFFAAIRFVLSDAYTNMGREERQSLLHEGNGPATMSAYVEIVFDNSDNRFPTGKDELVLRRSIGLKKDEYSLDKKSASKTDVMNLLESAGFSRSNPYYIVPQGRITSLTNAKDSERLQLLKEVAGTRVYEQRRQESLKIMDETDSKRSKIEELLEYIEERLTELEEEKEELKHYQEYDKQRRSLEYTIYHREQLEATEKLEDLEEAHRQDVNGSNTIREQHMRKLDRINGLEERSRQLQNNISMLKAERAELMSERDLIITRTAQAEIVVNELELNGDRSGQVRERYVKEYARIKTEIENKEKELAQLRPTYEEAAVKESELTDSLEQKRMQRQALYDKQGRNAQFRNQKERDSWIQKEVKGIKATAETQRNQVATLKSQTSDLEARKEEIARQRVSAQEEMKAIKEQLDDLAARNEEYKSKRNELTDKRKDLWREEAKINGSFESIRDDLRTAERTLAGTMDKNTSGGLSAIRRIVEKHNIAGVYGPLYELFDTDDRYRTAVEITAGGSLFHVVVDNDITATRVLDALANERVGRVTFMPLNRLRPKQYEYPAAEDAVPLLSKIRYDPVYAPAFAQVFGRAIICPDLETASKYAKSHNLNAITLEGDRVDRKGVLSGGYHDIGMSRLQAVKLMKSYKAQFEHAERRRGEIKENLSAMDKAVTEILSQMQQAEAKRKEFMGKRQPLFEGISRLNQEDAAADESLAKKAKILQSLGKSIVLLDMQAENFRNELNTPMAQKLSAQEQGLLTTLNNEISELQVESAQASTERAKLESQMIDIQQQLNSFLRRRRDELTNLLDNITVGDTASQLQAKKRELEEVQRVATALEKRIKELDKESDKLSSQQRELQNTLEKEKTEYAEENRVLERHQKNLDKYLGKRSILLKTKEQCSRNIRELGVLPEDAFEKYAKIKHTNELLKRLHKANAGLKKYSHVNKKAFEQYTNFTRQRDQLIERKGELDTSQKSIQELIDILDQRKDEAIERTFQQVKTHFAEVFERLVPAGKGMLIMQRSFDKRTDEDDEENISETQSGSVENYVGVSIKVSFNSKTDEGLIMQQLSGGQKSLVALALIFAIQRCDPAPFYLFDEIDANLDAQYRTAVADMIHELGESAQFVTTTFRPELLMGADKFYGVTFSNKVSQIHCISKDDAMNFVEREHTH